MNDFDDCFAVEPIGFLIVDSVRHASETGVPAYYGVDRLPAFVAPDPIIRGLTGEELVHDARLVRALDAWFDAPSTSRAFIQDEHTALTLLRELKSFGFALELLFCELAFESENDARKATCVVGHSEELMKVATYGFDVSWPSCNHSAIRQPGIVPGNEEWLRKLNQWGLLVSFKDARHLRDQYLSIYPYPPFEIYRVHSLKEG